MGQYFDTWMAKKKRKAKRRALNQTITDFEIALHSLPWYAFRKARQIRKQIKEVEKELENYR